MRLSRIQVKNFRGIEDSGEINIGDFLLLVGQNNSGKSTILKSLDLFFNNSEFDCEHDYPADKIGKIGYKSSTKIILKFEREGAEKIPHQLSYYFVKKRGFSNAVMAIEIEYPRDYNQKKERKIKINSRYRGIDSEKDNKYNIIFETLKKQIGYLYVPTERLGGDASDSRFIKELFLLVLEKSKTYNKTLRQYRLAIKEQFLDVEKSIKKSIFGFPNLENITFDFSKISLDNFQDDIKILVSTGKSDKIPLEKEGAGLRSSVIISIIKNIFDKINKNKKSMIIGIEEPENFLHPEAQRMLINELKSSQAIISTHSPIILNEISPREFKNILRCYKDKGLSFFQLSSDSNIKLLTRLYEDSDIVGGEFFFSNKCILVEGKTDRAIFRRYFRFKNVYSFPIFPAGSNTEFNGPINLLKNFNLKIVLITDEDSIFGQNKSKFKQALVDNKIANETSWSKFSSYVKKNINKKNGVIKIFKESKKVLNSDGLFIIPTTLEPSLINNENVDFAISWLLTSSKYLGITSNDVDNLNDVKGKTSIAEKVEGLKQILVGKSCKKRFITEQLFEQLIKKNIVPKMFSDMVDVIRQ